MSYFNLYPDQVQAILIYIRHLDAAEKEVLGAGLKDIPYLDVIALKDDHETDYGRLVDEVGGAWSWKAPEEEK